MPEAAALAAAVAAAILAAASAAAPAAKGRVRLRVRPSSWIDSQALRTSVVACLPVQGWLQPSLQGLCPPVAARASSRMVSVFLMVGVGDAKQKCMKKIVICN